jgi:GTP cyclohydrolase I
METESEKQATFPKFLPKPDETVLKWIGEYLKNSHAKKTPAEVAKLAKVSTDEIENIEKGIIHQNLGQFRRILRRGYGRKLEDILAKCYDAFKDRFNPRGKRPFDRDYYYAICLKNEGKKPPTPLLVGGDPDNFLWAVPFRKLIKQPLSVDLLELAPKRTRKKHLGETPDNVHDGIEVIHVINGTVTVTIETDAVDPPERKLKAGDSIHFNSAYEHHISNDGNTTSALLLITRLPELPSGK